MEATAASASQMSRFETEVLTLTDNLESLMALPVQWVDRVCQRRPFKKLILDMDSSVSETCGHQEGSVFSHFYRFRVNPWHNKARRNECKRGNHQDGSLCFVHGLSCGGTRRDT